MKKVTLLMVTLVLSISIANADETGTTNSDTQAPTTLTTTNVETGTGNSDMKKMREEEFKKLKEEEKAKIEANREKMKENRDEFKGERGTGVLVKLNLTDDQKAQVKVIMDAHKVKADAIKASVASGSTTKEDGLKQIEELITATNESLKALLGDNEEALKVLSLKKEMLDKNMEIRKENLGTRQDFRTARDNLKVKYKEKFIKAVGSKLDSVSTEKLNLILTRIDTAIEKTNSDTKMSQTAKDKILSQLDALKEIINEKLGTTDTSTDINVDELLQ